MEEMFVGVRGGLELVVISCGLCSRNDHSVIKQVSNGYRLARCNNCGLIFIDPQPDLRELRQLYNSKEYFEPKELLSSRAKARRAQERVFTMWLDRIEKKKRRGRILDIGCAGGEFLKLARRRGWEVAGVEISEYAANEARRKFNLDIYTGTLEEAKFPAAFFDVVNLAKVIEHIPNPYAFLCEVKRVLKIGGLLVLSAPNVARLTASWNAEGFPYHLYEFSPETLSRLVNQAGFVDIRILPNIRRSCLLGGHLRRAARYCYFGIARAVFLITGGRLNWCQSIDLFATRTAGEVE